jgi:tetratricopeptide (TPR) repeat protein
MFCKSCGNKLDTTKKFCTNCGTPSPVQPPKVEVPKKPWTTGRIVKYVVVGGIILLLLSAKLIFGAINAIEGDAVETNNNALSAYDSGNSSDAISQFRQAADSAVTNANKANSLINLAYVYSSEGQDAQAIATFKEAVAYTDSDSYSHHLVMGEIALLEGRSSDALTSYQKAYSLSPNEFQTNNALALFYLDLNSRHPSYEDYPKALTYALRADELSELESTKQNLAVAYYFNEQYQTAISILTSLSIDKDSYTAYWIGLSYINLGNESSAKFYLKKAIANGVEVPQEIKDYAYAE